MERARATWTDERLDDLARRVDNGFKRVESDLRSVRTEMNGLRTEMTTGFAHVNGRIDALQRTVLQIGGGMVAALVAGFLGVIATQL